MALGRDEQVAFENAHHRTNVGDVEAREFSNSTIDYLEKVESFAVVYSQTLNFSDLEKHRS